MRVGNKIYEPCMYDGKHSPYAISIDPETFKKSIIEEIEIDKKCLECNIYTEDESKCKGMKKWNGIDCLKEKIYIRTGFVSGGGEQKKGLKIVM